MEKRINLSLDEELYSAIEEYSITDKRNIPSAARKILSVGIETIKKDNTII